MYENMVQKNTKAKDGVVLALGSLIVGFLLGIPAMVYGVKGIQHANEYPGSGLKWLSIFNLVLGSLTTAVSLWFAIKILVTWGG